MQGVYNFFSNYHPIIQATAYTTPVVSEALMMLHISLKNEYQKNKNHDPALALKFYENAPKFLKTATAGFLIQTVSCVALAVLFGQPQIFIPLAFFAGICLLNAKKIAVKKEPSQPTAKFMQGAIKDFELEFQPLSTEEVEALLDELPELKQLPAAQGNKFAYDSILSINNQGIPARLEGTSNEELKKSMQFILFKIKQEPNAGKRNTLLLRLANCVQDCVPVTQGKISMMLMELNSIGGILKQVHFFILKCKEKALKKAIEETFPDMKRPSYADEHYDFPSLQFPHVRNGFLSIHGKELGLNMAGVDEDENKNVELAINHKDELLGYFYEYFSLSEVLKTFIIGINGRNGKISCEDLSIWCMQNEFQHEIFYDEQGKYPDYSPKPPEKDDYLPYLTEGVATEIFRKLGYIL